MSLRDECIEAIADVQWSYDCELDGESLPFGGAPPHLRALYRDAAAVALDAILNLLEEKADAIARQRFTFLALLAVLRSGEEQ